MKEKKIEKSALDLIERYLNLKIGDKKVTTPYFINQNRRRDLRAMIGKGTPEEIEMESLIWGKIKGIDFFQKTPMEIKSFLKETGIGVDCSGFIVHIINVIYQEKYNKNLWDKIIVPQKNIFDKIRYLLRPAENIGANILTDENNSFSVELRKVLPGDLIRSKGKRIGTHHAMIITHVFYSQENPIMIRYSHSSPYYGENNGVKFGEIEILDLDNPLEEQNWLEFDKEKVNHTKEGYLKNTKDNGIRRLKIFSQ